MVACGTFPLRFQSLHLLILSNNASPSVYHLVGKYFLLFAGLQCFFVSASLCIEMEDKKS